MASGIERALNKAHANCGGFPNTLAGVLDVGNQMIRPVVVLRPDQDWMTAKLKEEGIPFILAAEIWPAPNQKSIPVQRERGKGL